jgi:two-component system cell cycle sensor histidine kinase/response regulator CckA
MDDYRKTKKALIEELKNLRQQVRNDSENSQSQIPTTDVKQAERVQKVLLNISKSTSESESLQELLGVIHKQIATLIESKNFYVALYNNENKEYTFPYCVDEFNSSAELSQEEMRKSLTEYVRKRKTPLLIDDRTDKKMVEKGEVDLVGKSSHIWMGVPFEIDEQFSGVLVVQSYSNASSYTQDDLELMTFVTDHISWAIERKKAEQKLKESEESYRGLFDNANDAIYIQDLKGRFLDVNKTVEKMYGYDYDDFIGKTPDFLSAPGKNDLSTIVEKIKEAANGNPQRLEFWGKRKNGEVFPKEIRLDKGVYFGQKVIIAFAQDITERLENERQLKESEQRFRTLIENSPVAITISRKSKIIFVNDAYSKIFGFTEKKELMGTNFLKQIAASERKKIAERNQKREQRITVPTSYETVGLRKNGSTFPLNVNVTLINLLTGPATLAYIVDISMIKKAEEERLNLERKILHTQKLESLGVLAGGIAHDFNNLLTGIMGNTGLAMMHCENSSPAKKNLFKIENIASRAAELCNQMLAYSGKGKFVIQPIDINEVIREMTLLLNVSIPKKVSLKVSLDTKIPAIEADVTQVRQIIMNLITNAADSIGKKSGIITVKSSTQFLSGHELKSQYIENKPNDGNYTILEVSDSGCGMKQETLNKLFDPFFTTKFTGRGLGMAAVLGIVRGHKGTLMIESSFGVGTTVKIVLPVSNKKALTIVEKKHDNKLLKGKGSILVVDDEESVRSILKEALEFSGFNIILAEDGEIAIKQYKKYEKDIELIILDLTMPKLNGEETYKRLVKYNPKVKVILSSGFNAQDATKRFASNGIAGYLQKPYRLELLREKIKEVIGKK